MAPLLPAPEMESNDRSLKTAGGAAKAFQRLGRCDFGQLAARRLAREPGEKARQRRAVADMGLARAFDFQRRSCRPWAVGRDRRRA